MKKWMSMLVCLLLLSSCAMAQEAPQLLEPAGVQLNAVEAHMGEISKITAYPGSVVPYVEEFFFEQEGVIDVMHVIVGQQVKAGDPLVTLDTEKEMERAETLKRKIEQQQTNAAYEEKLAAIDLKMLEVELRKLMKQQPVDETAIALKRLDIESKKLEIDLAADLRQLEMKQLTAEMETLENDIAQNVLYAPYDGRVAYMSDEWQPGDYVGAFTPLIYLADDSRLFVESDYISNGTLKTAYRLYALIGDQRYDLTVTPLDEKKHLSQILSGVSPVRQYTFNEPDDALEAGQYASICIESEYRENALLIPTNALYHTNKTYYVYVMEEGVRVRREVKVGISTNWYTQITEGLQEGELIYVAE